MVVEVTREALEAMRRAARLAHPHEACGILLGPASRVTTLCEATNVHPSPQTHFEIDPQALIDAHRQARDGGPAVLGYFHSHPSGPAEPSATDVEMAAGDGSIWAICAGESDASDIRFFRSGKGGFTRLSMDLIDG
ncbi:predicted metal-dependent protease [Erythrobacter sp. NAP1]|nr:predicted metal-dependent protease [Erythrobacter sp. NAP1]